MFWPFNRLDKLVQSLGKGHPYTKDIVEVQDSKYKFVFVHDDLQRGHINHHLIEGNSRQVCRGFTKNHFDYRITHYGGKALPFAGDKKFSNHLKVKGRVCAVESWKIPTLDNHYKNGVEFARVKTRIIIVDRDHRVMSIGSEEFLKGLPPGMLKTDNKRGVRHYTSVPLAGMVEAYMYVAISNHWNPEQNLSLFRNPVPEFPTYETAWLPKFYRYPVARNRKE